MKKSVDVDADACMSSQRTSSWRRFGSWCLACEQRLRWGGMLYLASVLDEKEYKELESSSLSNSQTTSSQISLRGTNPLAILMRLDPLLYTHCTIPCNS
jgi:hypothetical protein